METCECSDEVRDSESHHIVPHAMGERVFNEANRLVTEIKDDVHPPMDELNLLVDVYSSSPYSADTLTAFFQENKAWAGEAMHIAELCAKLVGLIPSEVKESEGAY